MFKSWFYLMNQSLTLFMQYFSYKLNFSPAIFLLGDGVIL